MRAEEVQEFGSTRVRAGLRSGDGFRARGRRGALLLEAMVALVILAIAGTAAATLVSQSGDAVRRARVAEDEAREAGALLHAITLWTRDDLDRRLGERPQGVWRLRVQRPTQTLYEVVLVDSAATREILRTSLFRPEPRRPEWELPDAPGGMPQGMP